MKSTDALDLYVMRRLFAAPLVIMVAAIPVIGQRFEAGAGFGAIGLDATHAALTASLRVYLVGRFSFDPEFLLVTGENGIGTRTTAMQFGPGFAFTIRQGSAAPYVSVSPHFGRIERTFNCSFPSRCVVPSTSFAWKSGSIGGGVRIRRNSFFVSPEYRTIADRDGLYHRFTVGVGFAF